MGRLQTELVYDLLELARDLVVRSGSVSFQHACRRRAVSTAYYAVFHALCHVCAESLVGSGRADLTEAIFRTVEHGPARKLLTSEAARTISPTLDRIGIMFADLQRHRHDVDYRSSRFGSVSPDEARTLVDLALEAISLFETLDHDARLSVAVLLISRPRSS